MPWALKASSFQQFMGQLFSSTHLVSVVKGKDTCHLYQMYLLLQEDHDGPVLC